MKTLGKNSTCGKRQFIGYDTFSPGCIAKLQFLMWFDIYIQTVKLSRLLFFFFINHTEELILHGQS